jgi:hypothetical protein
MEKQRSDPHPVKMPSRNPATIGPRDEMLKKQQFKVDRSLSKCCFSSMKTSISRGSRPLRLVLAMAATVTLLPGCADFWRIKHPVTKVAAEPPEFVRPPSPPVSPEPEIRLEPSPEPVPEPPVVKPPSGPRPVAIPVPGKDGFVFSPYNNKVIDVKGIRSGALVADPTYPMSERKFFRVP